MIWLAEIAEATPGQRWFDGVASIMLIGAVAVAVMLAIWVTRRWARRQREAIERDRNSRRSERSAGRVDAWREGAQRYVDHDKLPEQTLDDTEPDAASEHEPENQEKGPFGVGVGEEPDEPDPYGLFKDKPYRDAEDEDEGYEDFNDDEESDEDDLLDDEDFH